MPLTDDEVLAHYQVQIADWAWGTGPNGDKIPDVVALEHKRPDGGLCLIASSTQPFSLEHIRRACLAHHQECPHLTTEV